MKGDAVDALKKCAEALQHGDSRLANAEMGRVLDLAEEEADPKTRRLIGYFAQALACRAYGLHPKYLPFLPSDWKFMMGECYNCLFTGRTISDVKGKSRVHVIELVKHMDNCMEWESFFDAVYDEGGHLTHLRLSLLVQEKVEFSKENWKGDLIEIAKGCGVELECNIIAVNSLADIDVSLLEMRDGEFVVVSCMFVFSKMLAEAVALEKVLLTVRDVIKPNIMIVADHDANHHQSDFLLRFAESLKYYSSLFEYKDLYQEWEAYYRHRICNIVACEGSNRVERHQTWAEWKSLLIHYGFSIFSFSPEYSINFPAFLMECENGIFMIRNTGTDKQPLFFISAWETSTSPFKSSGSNGGLSIISSESDRLQAFQVSPEDLYLIRMASLAETYDILQNIRRQCEVEDILIVTWANRVRSANLHHERGSSLPLKPILCFEDVVHHSICVPDDMKSLYGWQYEEGQGIVGKALKYDRPFYVRDIDESEENVCPYMNSLWKNNIFLGALAIKLRSAYTSCGNYVVQFLFKRGNMTLEKQKRLVNCIIDCLKAATPRFVKYGNQDPLVDLAEHDIAVSDTMLVRSNPPSQPTSDFNLNLINQKDGNAVDWQLRTQQQHYTGVLDAVPTQGNPLVQSTDAFGLKRKTSVVNPRDGDVLQRPHEQVPPIQPHVSATSNIKASRENTVAPPFGDFNMNGRISSSGINQTAEYHITDVQMPLKQGNKRQRTSRSEVWDHYEREKVVDGQLLAKCKYCVFKTDGSSKKGTSHLRKHLLSRHRIMKNAYQSSNLPFKNLETRGILKENSVLDQDEIHMDVAKFIIKYKLPLNIIEDEDFKNLFKRPQFELQSENDLGLSIRHVYDKERQKLLRYFDQLSSRSNLTINLWEDDTKEIVNCCLTVQFIDDSWTLKKKILSFERLEHDFDAASLCEIFKRVLLEWNIKEKTCSVTFHSSLSNVEMVHDEKIWPPGIFYLSYDRCIRDINCMIADISLKGIHQVYKKMNQQDNIGYTLMNVECSNNWRICSLIIAIVAVLHPSLKLGFVEFVYKQIYEDAIAKEHLDKISNFLGSLYDKYASRCSNHTNFTTAIGDTCSSSLANANDEVLDSFRKYKVSKQSRQELFQYLGQDEGSSMKINILNWWCNNSSRFPTLGMMARDFLAIPLSTIMSSSAFAKEIAKIISNSGDQESHIVNGMICCQDWLESTKPSACNEKCDEKLTREGRAWPKKYLLWDFTHEDLELLGKWKDPKMKGQLVGLDENCKVQDKLLAPLVIPLVDVDGSIIQGAPQEYYIGDEVVNKYFLLLTKRSEENPSMFLKHTSLDSSTASLLLRGDHQPSVPTWINPVEQIKICKLFLPLCFLNHWILFYVDIKDQKFVWLDSCKDSEMQMPNNYGRILEWFKGSLLPAMGLNDAGDWPFIVPGDIPKQENGIDCGIFVMKYADCLTHANCIGFPFSQDDMPDFRKRIFLDIYNGGIHVPEKLVRS